MADIHAAAMRAAHKLDVEAVCTSDSQAAAAIITAEYEPLVSMVVRVERYLSGSHGSPPELVSDIRALIARVKEEVHG